MKKHLLYIAASVLVLAGCAKNHCPEDNGPDGTITVLMPEIMTKTAFGTEAEGSLPLLWQEGDQIVVAQDLGTASEKKATYVLDGEGGSATGQFKYKSGATDIEVITDIVYPASSTAIPTAQTYTEGNFDPKSVVMTWSDAEGLGETAAQLTTEASVICLMLKSPNEADIKKIKTTLTYEDASSKTYTLTCPSVVLPKTAVPFYITVKGSESPCDVSFEFTHSNAIETKSATGKTFSAYEVSRFAEIEITAQELSSDLPSIGELYEDGVVFEVNNSYVKVMSIRESEILAWSTETISTGCTGDHEDGLENTEKLLALPSYIPERYPAVAWCITLGEGWYLPSPKELILIRKNLLGTNTSNEDTDKMAAANQLMKNLGGDEFTWAMYWSSKESTSTNACVARLNKIVDHNYSKTNGKNGDSGDVNYRARAVKKITLN